METANIINLIVIVMTDEQKKVKFSIAYTVREMSDQIGLMIWRSGEHCLKSQVLRR